MTIYRWSFPEPIHIPTTDISSLIRRLKDMPAEEVKAGREIDLTPSFFNGRQVLRTFLSKRKGEGVIGKLTIVNNEKTRPVLVVKDYREMDQRYGRETERVINRDNLLVAIMQGDGHRGMYVNSVITYSPKGESEGFWQRRR